MARNLIINADDFGLTAGISQAIVEAHEHGIVSSTSAIVVTPTFEQAAQLLHAHPGLGCGVHLTAVGEDTLLTPANDAPTLISNTGLPPNNWLTLFIGLMTGRIAVAEIEQEFRLQIERALDAGIAVTHLDSHQNVHLWPSIAKVVCRLAKSYKIPAVRLPKSGGRRISGLMLNRFSARFRRLAAAHGLRMPSAYEGFDQAGRMTLEQLLASITRLAALDQPVAELSCHPGFTEDPDRHRYPWAYQWGTEYAAITSPRARELVQDLNLNLVNFRDAFDE